MTLALGQRWKFTSANGTYFYIVKITRLTPSIVGLVEQSAGRGDYKPDVGDEKYSLWIDPKGPSIQTDYYDGTWEYLEGQDASR